MIAIETTVEGDTGKAVALMTSLTITGTGKGISGTIDEAKAKQAAKLLNPDLKKQIKEHPHR